MCSSSGIILFEDEIMHSSESTKKNPTSGYFCTCHLQVEFGEAVAEKGERVIKEFSFKK